MSIIGKFLGGLVQDKPDETGSNLSGSRITDFISYFSGAGDIARPDYFNVIIDVPNDVTREVGLSSRDLMFQCEAAELPGRNIDMTLIRHNTFLDRMPVDVNYPDVTLTFICRSDLLEKKLFDIWQEKMIGTQEGIGYGLVKYKISDTQDRYDCSVRICQKFQLSTDQNASVIRLIDAIPTVVSSMPLSWQDNGFHKLSVTFSYRKWVDETIRYSDLNIITYQDALDSAETTLPDSTLLDKIKTVVDIGRFADVYGGGSVGNQGIVKTIQDIFD